MTDDSANKKRVKSVPARDRRKASKRDPSNRGQQGRGPDPDETREAPAIRDTDSATNERHGDDAIEEVIPLVEEEVRVGKRRVTTGRVRVQTLVEEVEEIARTTLDEDVVEVERVAINRPIMAAPAIRTEGDVTIVPVVEEVIVIEKRLVLKEELHIRRRRQTETIAIPITLRKQRAVIERLPGNETAEPGEGDPE